MTDGKVDGGKKRKKRSAAAAWTLRGILLSAILAAGFAACYGRFRKSADTPPTSGENVACLFQNTYLLYRDLYNHVNKTQLDCLELYLDTPKEWEWIKNSQAMEEYGRRYDSDGTEEMVLPEDTEDTSAAGWEDGNFRSESEYYCVGIELDMFRQIFDDLSRNYAILNRNYGYVITDHKTGAYLSNLSSGEIDMLTVNSCFYVSFVFDESGGVTVGDRILADEGSGSEFRRTAYLAAGEGLRLENILPVTDWICGDVRRPTDCTVTYAIPKSEELISLNYDVNLWSLGSSYRNSEIRYYQMNDYQSVLPNYYNAGVYEYLLLFAAAVFLAGLFLPERKAGSPWMEEKGVYGIPFEMLFAIGCAAVFLGHAIVFMTAYTASGEALSRLGSVAWLGNSGTRKLILLGNLPVLALYFLIFWYLGVCLRALRRMGLKEYAARRLFFFHILRTMGKKAAGKVKKAYNNLLRMDLTKNARKQILKIVIINALILFVMCMLWFGGLAMTLLYSLGLYLLLRKYVSDLQKKYGILLRAVDEIAEGNLNVSIPEDLGVFEPFKPQILKIQNGFKKAVDEELRSQRMKGELITNVSHDLKTPLTAIITYVNLLKDPDLTPEQRSEYLDTLERKSMRLKVLIEDLFEVSKANSGNVTLNLMPVDIMNLIRQVCFEMKDKLDEAGLDVRLSLSEEKIVLPLDSQKTYRVYENLFSNVAKYALAGTRVYVNGFRDGQRTAVTIKNISAMELTVDPSELTERFVRGDQARNTEGSGLGLAIAKSFLKLQGGDLEVEVDGDLFKVTTVWKTDGETN